MKNLKIQLKNRLTSIISKSYGLPNYSSTEYIQYVEIRFNKKLNLDEKNYIKMKKYNIKRWITKLTHDLTKDNF